MQYTLKANRLVFNPISCITASFVHGNVVHLEGDLFAFILSAFLLYFINKKTNQQRFFFYSMLTIFTVFPVIDYGIQLHYGTYKSATSGFGLSLVDSGLIGLTVPSLILFFKSKLEKFNSLLFFYSLLLLELGLASLPYAPSSQLWLLSLIFILGFAVGVFEYRRVLRYLASLRRQTKTKMESFLESCLVLFTMFFYFFSIVGLFPSSMMWRALDLETISISDFCDVGIYATSQFAYCDFFCPRSHLLKQ